MDITPNEAAALEHIIENPGCSTAAVGYAIGGLPICGTKPMRSLESKGLAYRRQVGAAMKCHPTAAGRALHALLKCDDK